MKPNKPLSRESLLHIIHQSLSVQSNKNDGTLGVVVRQILTRLSPDALTAADQNVNAIPVPLHQVAAYVDGTLTDLKKQNAITQAALTDPGLMMEIVSAIRAREETPPERNLPKDLRARLVALQSAATTDSQTPPRVEPILPEVDVDQANHLLVSLDTTASTASSKASFPWRRISALTTAAALLLAIGWWFRSGIAPETTPIVKTLQGVRSPKSLAPLPTNSPGSESADADADGPMLVEQPNVNAIPSPDSIYVPGQSIDLTPGMPAPDKLVPVDPSPQGIAETDPGQGFEPMRPQPPAQRDPLVAEWTQIDGLLLRSVFRHSVLRHSVSSIAAETSRSSNSVPASVVAGNSFDLASESIGERLRLQTLPLCRATAKLAGGGELVLAADTQVELTLGGAIDLHYGSFAILGLNAQSVVHLGRNIANSVSVQSKLGGSIVVRKTIMGMEVDVSGEAVKVDGKTFTDSRLNIAGRMLAVERVEDAPARLPRWTRERVDRIEVGRNILGQLSASTNVRASLLQSLRSGGLRGAEAATLRGWLVAASGDHVLRLLHSPDALIRETVLQHMRAVNPSDPRHRSLWRHLQSNGNNRRSFSSARSYFVELWAGRRPNQARRETLLRMLQSSDPGVRVMANYLLRSFYGPGPRFELNTNAATRTRTIPGWRSVINRVD